MSLEIERKFLLRHDGWRASVRTSEYFRQGYLNDEERCSIRVRIAGGQAWLNIKSATIGAERLEFEYAIPPAEAQLMLDRLSCKPLIEKRRHFVEVGAHTWEIDEFEGDNAGLVVAEIELDHAGEAFEKPDWVGEEVTHDVRYYNTCLSSNPYKHWASRQ